MPAFRAACRKHPPAIVGRHTFPETMFVPSLTIGGLKCPLHDCIFKWLLSENHLLILNESAKVWKKWKNAKKYNNGLKISVSYRLLAPNMQDFFSGKKIFREPLLDILSDDGCFGSIYFFFQVSSFQAYETVG